MKCNKCGFENEDDSVFCINCGSKLEKNNFKKCVVCGSDISDDSEFCPKCGSKQDDYIKCSVCGEANLKTFKFCTRCGTPFDGTSASYSDTHQIKNVSTVNSEPIISIPENDQDNTSTHPTGPIIDNTEVYNTTEFVEEKSNAGKIVLIIFGCIFGVALLCVAGLLTYNTFFKKDDIKVQEKQEIKEEEKENKEDKTEEKKEEENKEKKEEKNEVSNLVSYYKLNFVDTVKIRTSPSLNGDHIGKVSKGSTLIAFDKTSSDGYTWYKIGYDEWVADDGTFLNVSSFENEKVEISNHSSTMARVKYDTSIYDGTTSNSNSIGYLTKSTYIKVFETINDGGVNWYKISPCEYIKASDVNFE